MKRTAFIEGKPESKAKPPAKSVGVYSATDAKEKVKVHQDMLDEKTRSAITKVVKVIDEAAGHGMTSTTWDSDIPSLEHVSAPSQLQPLVKELRERGFQVSINDFELDIGWN